MKYIHKIILISILLLAIFLRFYKIDTIPSLNPDEAALGYNDYSLLQTGKDILGSSWPLHIKSFGDYQPNGYAYLALPFVKFLGLNPLAVRLPNLILSVLTIFIVYKLVLLLSKSNALSLYSAIVLTLSPWHIHFSRGAWESSTALFFLLLGIYWFYTYIIHKKYIYLFIFPLPLVISLYVYNAVRIIAPILFIVLFYSYIVHHKTELKKFILPFLIGIILSIPVIVSLIYSGGASRFNGVGLTADLGPILRSEELINQHQNSQFSHIIHNKRILYLYAWAQNYTSHFDPNFLFTKGDDVPRLKSPNMGQLYLLELPFLIIGIVFLLKHYRSNALTFFIFSFLFIAPLASSLTFQTPSALRSLPMVIPLTIIIAAGLHYFFQLTAKLVPHNYFFISIFYIYSLFFFLDANLIQAPNLYPFAWNTGFDQVVPLINANKNKFKNIYLTNKYDQPYILYLFYSKYPPQNIQSQIKLTPPDQYGFSTVTQIDNIHFEKINWNNIPISSLVIASDEIIPTIPTQIINFPNSSPGFKIYIK